MLTAKPITFIIAVHCDSQISEKFTSSREISFVWYQIGPVNW